MMEKVLITFALQGLLGAFDTLYHHEFTERLPWRRTAGTELGIHGVRNLLYAVIFFSLGWVEWRGLWAWLFIAILLVEIVLTLWDFVVEDRTRSLPATERITHTILAINYGIILGFLSPELLRWREAPTSFAAVNYGWLSWTMTLYGAGVLLWAGRDMLRGKTLRRARRIVPASAALHQRVLVTGGTGFLGAPLCQRLIDAGCAVTILTRDAARAASVLTGRVTFIHSLDALTPADRFDTVINLAGEPLASSRWTEAKKAHLRQSRLGTTEQVVDYIARAAHKPARLLSGSAIGYYGYDLAQSFTESTPPNAGFTHDLCTAWEAAAQQAAQYGVAVSFLRTGIVLHPDGGALAPMLPPFDLGMGGPMGNGRQWMSWIHREDWIAAVLFLMTREVAGGVNLAAPEAVRNHAFARSLGRAMHRPAFLPLPAFVLRLLMGEMAEALLLTGQRVLPARLEELGFTFRFPTLIEALDDLF